MHYLGAANLYQRLHDAARWRIYCHDCDARLPFRQWFAGERRCRSCDLRRLALLIDEAEARRQRKSV